MKTGKYGPGNTNFDKLKVKRLPLHFYNAVDYSKAGCGSTALALLTGDNPFVIATKVKKGNFTDSFMKKYLRKHGISVYEVNKANLTRNSEWKHSLQDNHVVLFSALVRKKDSSWFLAYNKDVLFHNFEVIKADFYTLLSFPITSAFVLYKKEWAE